MNSNISSSVKRKVVWPLLLGIVLAFGVTTHASAQSDEGISLEYVPANTYFLFNMNFEKMFASIGDDCKALEAYKIRDSAKPTDFTNLRQLMACLMEHDGESNENEIPSLTLQSHVQEIEQQAFLNASNDYLTYEPETKDGVEFFRGRVAESSPSSSIEFVGGIPSIWFPTEDLVIQGTSGAITTLIDQEDGGAEIPEIAEAINRDAEVHLIFRTGENLTSMPGFDFITMLFSLPGLDITDALNDMESMELIVDLEQQVPMKLTIEMGTESMAESVEEAIKTGLQAVPALMTMAQTSFESEMERDDDAKEMVEADTEMLFSIVNEAITAIELAREGTKINVTLTGVDSLEQLPRCLIALIVYQQMRMEKMMQRIGE